jgi:iron(III) transport system ATP-binding protein
LISIELNHVSKTFVMPDGREVGAVDNVSLEIQPGEFFFILGPSGCGKTTLLRIIAGFVEPDKGKIIFDHKDVTKVAAHKRGAAMVFQNYALFPHLNVFDNVAYGLKVRKVSSAERREKVEAALSLVQMDEFGEAQPGQLSGGQQQRIALARALVINPKALLLDEPLSNLDARLREEMRIELQEIHQAAGTATIYVTHDQKEALSLADRIAVMNDGRIEQAGTPADLYTRPQSAFVAEFVGNANLIPGTITGTDPWGEFDVLTALGLIKGQATYKGARREQRVMVMIRPEWIKLGDESSAKGLEIQAKVRSLAYLGDKVELELAAPDNIKLKARIDPRQAKDVNQGDLLDIVLPDSDTCILPG